MQNEIGTGKIEKATEQQSGPDMFSVAAAGQESLSLVFRPAGGTEP